MLKLYYTDADVLYDDRLYEKCLNDISEERKKTALSYGRRSDRNMSVAAAYLLRTALSDIFGLNEKNIKYSYNKNGRPYIEGYSDIYFNISHSKGKVITAVSDCNVGCDIEKIGNADMKTAKRFFHRNEYEYLLSIDDEKVQTDSFYCIWTLKECYIKAKGTGLTTPLNSFEIKISDDGITVYADDNSEKYNFAQPLLFDGYCCAVCSENDANDIELIEINIEKNSEQ